MEKIFRGCLKRCPNCGGKNIFETFWTLRHHCPSCGMVFERDAGYGTGGMIVNTAVTIAAFLLIFTGVMVVTWPDVPWTATLIATIAINVVLPVVFYPWSRTIFLGLDLSVRALSDEEQERAAAVLAGTVSSGGGVSEVD